ncbi:Transmembrane_domain-containing protein [Hexamita inflata]|uniref:Transmembrane domain-containing protein n=1 Tax=Hexamita inflata TaxID=28002 RepID=A0AA86PQZ6_9EUKA|nr:Transmembrane domain-containing protein [Hexamita inflata]
MFYAMLITWGIRLFMSQYPIKMQNTWNSANPVFSAEALRANKASMLQYVDQLFYSILPSNPILKNLCMCGLDAVVTSLIYLTLRQFLRYSVKPNRRFNYSLIAHCTILITSSPLYMFYVPFQITHFQCSLFLIYVTCLLRQKIFVTSLIVSALFMLNTDFAPILLAQAFIFIQWATNSQFSVACLRIVLLLCCLFLLIIIYSIPFILVNTYRGVLFNPFFFVFRSFSNFWEVFQQSKCVLHANVFMFLRVLVQMLKYLGEKTLGGIQMPYLIQVYAQKRSNSFAKYQITAFLYYIAQIRFKLKISETQFNIKPMFLVNYFMIIFYSSFYYTNNSIFLLLQVNLIIIYAIKKLNLQQEFGTVKVFKPKRQKSNIQKKKKICIKTQEVSQSSAVKFNDLYNGLEGLGVIRAISRSKSPKQTYQEPAQPNFMAKWQFRLGTYIDQIIVQANIIVFTIISAVGLSQLSQQIVFYDELLNAKLVLHFGWIVLLSHSDDLFVNLLDRKTVLIVGFALEFFIFYIFKRVWMFYVVQSIGYVALVFAGTCLVISMQAAREE